MDDSDLRSPVQRALKRWPPKHVAIVRLSALGDVIHTLPLAVTLRHHFPSMRLTWVVTPPYDQIVSLCRSVDRVIPIDLRAFGRPGGLIRAIRSLRTATRGDSIDVALDPQGLFKSAAVSLLLGAELRVGLTGRHRRESASRWLSNITVGPRPSDQARTGASFTRFWIERSADVEAEKRNEIPPRTRRDSGFQDMVHTTDRALALARAVGAWPPMVRSDIDIKRLEAATELVVDARERADRSMIVVNIGGAWPTKRWPPRLVGRLLDLLIEAPAMVPLVVWGPGEEEIASTAVSCSRMGRPEEHLAPETDLLQLARLCAEASLVISADSGPLHLAASVGTPTIGLYGPTSPGRSGPVYDVRGEQVPRAAVLNSVACGPCYKSATAEWLCMTGLSPALVFEAVRDILVDLDT